MGDSPELQSFDRAGLELEQELYLAETEEIESKAEFSRVLHRLNDNTVDWIYELLRGIPIVTRRGDVSASLEFGTRDAEHREMQGQANKRASLGALMATLHDKVRASYRNPRRD